MTHSETSIGYALRTCCSESVHSTFLSAQNVMV